MDPITTIVSLATSIINKIWGNKDDELKRQFILELQDKLNDIELLKGQMDINKAEAANPNRKWISWRELVGYSCAFAVMWTYIIQPFLVFIAALVGHPLPVLPELDMGQLMFQPQPGQRTATQAQIGQQGLQIKSQARIDVVEDFTVEVATALAQTLWQFYDREKVSEELGVPVTANMWPDLPKERLARRRVIQSEIQFRIDFKIPGGYGLDLSRSGKVSSKIHGL